MQADVDENERVCRVIKIKAFLNEMPNWLKQSLIS